MQSAAVVALFDSLHVGKASYTKCYTIMGLFFNVAYGVRVPARNDFGLSVPQFSIPVTVAPPRSRIPTSRRTCSWSRRVHLE